MGFDLDLPFESLKAALIVSLLSVWVLVGLFHYLNRYTKRRYFSIWTGAWLFYALWLTLNVSLPGTIGPNWFEMAKNWSVGTAAVFLLWGSMRFLKQEATERMLGLFMLFLVVWSYVTAYHLDSRWEAQMPIFGLIGVASMVTGGCFYRFRQEKGFIGAGLLAFGFSMWGLYLTAFPFFQLWEEMMSSGFFISALLQLFIAVSMIILVLEEARRANRTALERIKTQSNEKKMLRQEFALSQERFQLLFEHASDGIVIAEGDYLEVVETNEKARELLGEGPEQRVKGRFMDYCRISLEGTNTPHDARAWFELICNKKEFSMYGGGGRVFPVEISGTVVPSEEENKPTFQFFIRETTDRIQLQQQLRQAEKLSALGQMISGVAHELNNPLSVIKGYSELALTGQDLGKQARSHLEKIAHESDRTVKMVSNFLAFARQRTLDLKKTSINDLVRLVVELNQFDLQTSRITVRLDLDPNIPPCALDQDQIKQVLASLVKNSFQAITQGGFAGRMRIRTEASEGQIELRVEDSGPGVPEEIVAHLFEPFFTTKGVGVGTGLGLSIAHGIVSEHNGRIFYQRSNLGGAAFVVQLPIVSPDQLGLPTQVEPKPAPVLATPVGSGKLLVLDDEAVVADLLGEILAGVGYTVVLSNSGADALALLAEDKFDLVLCDFRMPGMDGREFHEAVVKRWPEMSSRFIFLTGDVLNEETKEFLRSSGARHLGKPFHLDALHKIVQQGLTTFRPATG